MHAEVTNNSKPVRIARNSFDSSSKVEKEVTTKPKRTIYRVTADA